MVLTSEPMISGLVLFRQPSKKEVMEHLDMFSGGLTLNLTTGRTAEKT